jgi:hypothetical protein
MPRYSYTTTLAFGDDGEPGYVEVEVELSFTVAWGRPAVMYLPNGDPGYPADPDEIDDIRLEKVNGKPRPWGMYDGWIANEDDEFATVVVERLDGDERALADMLTEAAEQAAADYHEAMEYRAEMRREDALLSDASSRGE